MALHLSQRRWKYILIPLVLAFLTCGVLLRLRLSDGKNVHPPTWRVRQKTWKNAKKVLNAPPKKSKPSVFRKPEVTSPHVAFARKNLLRVAHPSEMKHSRRNESAKHTESKQGIVNADCYRYSDVMRVLPEETLRRNRCEKRLPKAMIVGVKKCGTMTLQKYLGLHPAIAINGEIPFPAGDNFTLKDVSLWKSRMTYSSPQMLPMVENPGYVRLSKASHERLKSFIGDDIKFILIIRDPVVRAVSDYVHKLTVLFQERYQQLPYLREAAFTIDYRGDILKNSFNATVIDEKTGEVMAEQRIVTLGRYIEYIPDFADVFDRDNLLILDGNAFINDPLPTVQRIEDFLGITKFYKREHFVRNPKTGFFCAHVPERPHFTCANPSIKGRPHPTVDNKTTEKLRDYYRPFNKQLAEEFDLDFPWLFE